MNWSFLFTRKAETYQEKFIKGAAGAGTVGTVAWIGLALIVPDATIAVFAGGLLIIAAAALFLGLFMAWDG